MNNKLLKPTVTMTLTLLFLCGIACLATAGQEVTRSDFQNSTVEVEPGITGVWQPSITQRDCRTGLPVAPPFPGLLTFNQGGTLAETNTSLSPSLRSPGHGIWRDFGGRNYYSRFMFYRFNESGMLIGSQRLTQSLDVSAGGDEFTSSGTVEVLDTNGSVLGKGCATSVGTRFK